MLERNVKDTKNAIIAKMTMIFVNAKVLKVLKLLISTLFFLLIYGCDYIN